MSFQSARALWERAEERRQWIGDDHGDPYETALLRQHVPIEMQIALKELLEHLRSALDYSARAICTACEPSSGQKIYFPIAQPFAKASDFRALVGKNMPGVLQARPDLVQLLESYQPFTDPANLWLSDLATLVNVAKHEYLTINDSVEVPHELTLIGPNTYISKTHSGEIRMSGRGLTVLRGDPDRSDGVCKMGFLCLQPIKREFLGFLRDVLPGTRKIIDTLDTALHLS